MHKVSRKYLRSSKYSKNFMFSLSNYFKRALPLYMTAMSNCDEGPEKRIGFFFHTPTVKTPRRAFSQSQLPAETTFRLSADPECFMMFHIIHQKQQGLKATHSP